MQGIAEAFLEAMVLQICHTYLSFHIMAISVEKHTSWRCGRSSRRISNRKPMAFGQSRSDAPRKIRKGACRYCQDC